ncbi:MAG: hypothetical protein IJW05_12310 [Lentisphaeria bacterium]|nr:hypothetical protein [Lentisphaeria bacterium]
MGKRKEEPEHVDLCGGSCWGSQKLRKKNGTDEYVGTCKFQCRLKEECIRASREEQENIQFGHANIPYNPAIGEDDGEVNGVYGADRENGGNVSPVEPAAGDGEEQPEDYVEMFLRKNSVPVDLAPAFREALKQFFFQMDRMPRFMKVLSGSILGKMSQAELARREGLTRQAINIGISNEITKMVAPELKCGNLDGMERVVFDLWRQGYSLGMIAKKMKISKSKVYRVKRKFGAKNAKSETKNKIRLPWKKKNQNARKKARWREVQNRKEVNAAAKEMLETMLKELKG